MLKLLQNIFYANSHTQFTYIYNHGRQRYVLQWKNSIERVDNIFTSQIIMTYLQ